MGTASLRQLESATVPPTGHPAGGKRGRAETRPKPRHSRSRIVGNGALLAVLIRPCRLADVPLSRRIDVGRTFRGGVCPE